MAEELKIIIDADVSKAKAGLHEVADESERTVNSLNKLPDAAIGASAGLDKLGNSAVNVGPATTQASNGAQKLVSNLVKLPPIANSSAESTKKFVTQLKETNSVLINVASGTPKATQQIVKLQLGVSHLGDTLETLKAKANVTRDFINTERDVTKIAVLQRQLQALEAEILRVQNLGKEGIIPTEVSEQAFSGLISGANTAFTALRRIAFVLPGIGVAGILGGLSDAIIPLAKDLLNLADSFDEAELQAAQFQNQLKSLNDFIESTKGELDFSAEVAKLKNQLTLGPGFQTDILGKAIDVKTAEDKLKNLNTVLDVQFDQLNHLLGNASTTLSKEGKKLFDTFGGVPELISDELIQKLSKNDQTFLTNIKTLSTDIEKINKERGETTRQIEILNIQKQVDVHNQQLKEQKDFHDKQLKESKEFIEKVNRQTIALAKEAEKVFAIPLTLKFDDTDLDIEKLRKARDVLAGIKDFSIKARVDIELPDIKELPKEQVEKFFKNVPDALQDAIDKGLIQPHDGVEVPIKIIPDAFSKEIQEVIDKFNQQKIELPLDLEIRAAHGEKGADFLIDLIDSFKEEVRKQKLKQQFEDAINGALANIQIEAVSSIGEAIGEAISGGDVGKAFKQFGQTLGSAVEALGKRIIALGVAAALTKKAISSLFANPVLAIAAGAALVAIGAALKNLIGGGLKGFAKGGRPPVGEWVVVGEKGPELAKFGQPVTIFSNQQSKSILSSSVRESNSIKEYFITEKINQALKEHTEKISSSIKESIKIALVPVHIQLTDTIKSIASSNEKLTAYSYKLHEVNNSNIQSIKESFVKTSTLEKHFTEKLAVEKYLKEFASKTSEIKKASENYISVNNPEAKYGTNISQYEYKESFEKLTDSFKDQFKNIIESFISNSSVSNILQGKETTSTLFLNESTISNKSFSSMVDKITENKLTNVFDKLIEWFGTSIKEIYENYQGIKESSKEVLSVLGSQKTSSIDREKTFYDSFERITSDIKNVISKIQIDKSSESYKSEISLLSEKINNSFSKLDKVTERINTSSVKSFNVEKIINNNFITDSFRETFKTFSLEKLQREFHIPAFAGGGAVFGPTLAILGEGFGISRSNPEFVGTASQLKGIQGGTFDVNVNVNGDISFDMGKLALALNREERSHLRTNGKRPF